jgi:hypothetical protein
MFDLSRNGKNAPFSGAPALPSPARDRTFGVELASIGYGGHQEKENGTFSI